MRIRPGVRTLGVCARSEWGCGVDEIGKGHGVRSAELDEDSAWEYVPLDNLGDLRPGDLVWIRYRGRVRKVGKHGGLGLTWGVTSRNSAMSSRRTRVRPESILPSATGQVLDVESKGFLVLESDRSLLRRLVLAPEADWIADWGHTRVDTEILCWVYRRAAETAE
jgi:hypothetical protein